MAVANEIKDFQFLFLKYFLKFRLISSRVVPTISLEDNQYFKAGADAFIPFQIHLIETRFDVRGF